MNNTQESYFEDQYDFGAGTKFDYTNPMDREKLRLMAEHQYFQRRMYRDIYLQCKAAQVEMQQALALVALLTISEECNIGNFAHRMQIEHHSAVSLADRMEERGLIKREKDGIFVHLRLTEIGESKALALGESMLGIYDTEARDLRQALTNLLDAIQQ
jgi:DNA-binding MarR family transcriptional regulator